ncbi:hypothetical protein N5J77_05945 [Sphingobium yanoikuyae]|jgi:hypothetical protein|uniref:Uncharacterized protein n=1 Tax=Sphingobium yanoikuyae TaxID=13690 RepID=A0AA42WRV2_SPHYA|nr:MULTISPECIES: hypothetical protein [Sphingobium]MBV2150407.1 hypothetical protein [Sphingobium sp. AS12]MDH2130659.1 hypothetical protein [Sphingobium yanoikuyae]MDH2151006.1 hypothetical protein [Sphingobium yanoikuyae]MDH2166144.1 hypothetical protein [Sphingobium yanoikuyae]QWT14329.1 hypothetical protein GTV57_00525 [Sphingobium xenophagum]
MGSQQSRAYKLQLSDEGIHLFLQCHCRLCHLAGDFLPYGTTLFIAVDLLHQCAADDLIAELVDPKLDRLGGRKVRHVGTSNTLSRLVDEIVEAAGRSEAIHPLPQVWRLYLSALIHMQEAEDIKVIQSFREMPLKTGRSARRSPR